MGTRRPKVRKSGGSTHTEEPNFAKLAFSATGVRPPARLLTAETEIGRLWGSPRFVFGPRHWWYVSATDGSASGHEGRSG